MRGFSYFIRQLILNSSLFYISEKIASPEEKSKISAWDAYFTISSIPFCIISSVEYFLLIAKTASCFITLKKHFPFAVLNLKKVNSSIAALNCSIASSHSTRGTSTYDGISIAWAIAEFLHENPARAKTLFATHYHELNEMSELLPRIQNYNVSVKELKDTVLFIRKLVKGGSAHSFGIHVAKMAGMPQMVIQKAQKLLKKLEKNHSSDALNTIKSTKDEMQLNIFNMDDPLLEEIREDILNLDINTLTPVEALMKLNELKRMLLKK